MVKAPSIQIAVLTSSFGELDARVWDLLRRDGLEAVPNPLGRAPTVGEMPGLLREAVAVIAGLEPYGPALFDLTPRLKVISRCGAGVDNVDLAAAEARGIAVLSTPSAPTQAVAELALGLILNLLRYVTPTDSLIRQGVWKKRMGFSVGEMTFGFLGLGKIGKKLAEILRGLGGNVIGYDKNPDAAWCRTHGVIPADRDEVLRSADVLCLHLPHDPDLHHCIGEKQLAMMKRGSFLVNTSRGSLVDEEALCRALTDGRLAGAALDVFEKEPYRGKLVGFPNVVMTAHMGSYARAGRMAMEREAVENMLKELRRQGLWS